MINHNTALRISSALNKEILFCYTIYFFHKKKKHKELKEYLLYGIDTF